MNSDKSGITSLKEGNSDQLVVELHDLYLEAEFSYEANKYFMAPKGMAKVIVQGLMVCKNTFIITCINMMAQYKKQFKIVILDINHMSHISIYLYIFIILR